MPGDAADGTTDIQLQTNGFQQSEISELQWITAKECIQLIRPYHAEKRELIQDVNEFIMQSISMF